MLTLDAANYPVISGNTTIESRQRDTLTATIIGCGGGYATAMLMVDPSGVVFDSHGNSPLAGATVTLIDVTGAGNGGAANSPAHVFDVDGTTPLPSTIVTVKDGTFSFLPFSRATIN